MVALFLIPFSLSSQAAPRRTSVLVSYAPGVMSMYMDERDGGYTRLGVERRTRLPWLSVAIEAEQGRLRTAQREPGGAGPFTTTQLQLNRSVSGVVRVRPHGQSHPLYFLSGVSLDAMRFESRTRAAWDSATHVTVEKRTSVRVPVGLGAEAQILRLRTFIELSLYLVKWREHATDPVGGSVAAFGLRF